MPGTRVRMRRPATRGSQGPNSTICAHDRAWTRPRADANKFDGDRVVALAPARLHALIAPSPLEYSAHASTGRHTVADLHCASCDAEVGWMYIKAPTGDQRYKEGESACRFTQAC